MHATEYDCRMAYFELVREFLSVGIKVNKWQGRTARRISQS